MSVRRLVEDCIRAGMAGIRIDDQAIEGKRATGTAGIEVAPIDVVLAVTAPLSTWRRSWTRTS